MITIVCLLTDHRSTIYVSNICDDISKYLFIRLFEHESRLNMTYVAIRHATGTSDNLDRWFGRQTHIHTKHYTRMCAFVWPTVTSICVVIL